MKIGLVPCNLRDKVKHGGAAFVSVRAIDSGTLGLPAEATVTMAISGGQGIPEGLYGPRLRFPLADHLHEH